MHHGEAGSHSTSFLFFQLVIYNFGTLIYHPCDIRVKVSLDGGISVVRRNGDFGGLLIFPQFHYVFYMFPFSAENPVSADLVFRDNHKRAEHQDSAAVTDIHGEEWEVMRQDGFYHCPVGNCAYKNENPKYLNVHMKECKGGHVGQAAPSPAAAPGVRVVPFGTDIIVSEALAKYGLVWNASCRILICVQCNKGVPPCEVATHRNHDLNRTVAKRADVLQDLDEYVQHAVPPTPPVLPPGYVLGVPCEPIEGLKIYHGFACQICHAAFPAKNSMKEHFREKHQDQYKNRSLHMIATRCQKIYSHNLRLYFAVLPHQARPHVVLPGLEPPRSPSPQAAPCSEAVKMLSKKFDLHAALSNLTPSPTSDNQLSNWLYVSGIHHYMTDLIKKGKSIQQLMTPAEDLPPVLAMAPLSLIGSTLQ
ncbi:hypothetical protein DFH28DRAFT_1140011 [Melampsora americana]|nr:hypothetical protein DFH28DRAFT_1140011 [Melampsora americana]